ncbi:MAG: O-antigen ligase family protein [Gaiellaceae bacterium]
MPALSLRDRGLAPVAALTFVVAGGLLVWALFFGGADSPTRLAWIGGAAAIAASVVVAAGFAGVVVRPRLGRAGVWCVACLAAVVVWQGASIVWSVLPDNSWDYLNRGLAYLAFLVLGLFVAAIVPRAPRATASAFAVLVACVIAYALLAKGIPSLYPDYGRLARLRSPVGFWNALALLGDFAVVLGLWRASDRRFDGALLVFGGVLTVLLAYSRGGILVGVVAVAAWLWLDVRRLEALAALLVGGGAAVAVFGFSLALNGVSDDGQPESARAHDGRLFLLAVVLAAVVVAVVARRIARIRVEPDERRRTTLALFAVVGVACLAGVVVAALNTSGATSASAGGAHCAQGAARFGCGSSDERLDWWGQAWAMFERRPVGGTGAASFELAHRLRRAEFVRPTTEPHNFALQSLGETGIVGFVLFAAAVILAAIAVRRRLGDAAAVALAVCLLAYLGNILIDIGWDYVAVSAPAFLALGVLLAEPGTTAARREPIWALGALALGATACLSLAAPSIARHKVDEAIATASPALAAQAHSWNPLAIDPLLTEAALEGYDGRPLKALRLYRQATDAQPENPQAWVERGLFELDSLRDPCGAYRSLGRAYALDRYNRAVALDGGPLDTARSRAKKRGCA